ncbi:MULTISPECIES: DUF4382 domain-containing protein [unclassified Zunongwangia]|uniref:DUF4382 domain-containing protein n=1 Tax=unclassified Zunongwangia TaxID=2632541 RepID=UPI0022DD8861|nr:MULTISPECIES: DUF4382 domain-containing protein [unclassified Zunongwangia]WBL22196.1 DUF4382 domain-containing protein [Zunongwangia sp. HRR-M8]WBL25855.1 DUF4382 domain-containing protein [Zunongwangia sp. HGR-M22]
MKKQILNFKTLFLLVFAGLTLTSCSDDDDNVSTEENARVAFRMVDAPGDFDEVNIDVEEVRVQVDAEGEDDGWILLDTEAGIYNLLELTGGVSQLLADEEIAPGYAGQIRLILGDDNSVVVDGEQYALATPSAQQSGLKLNLDKELESGESYTYTLDFDVEESIVNQGNGGYLLKPVIRLSAEENSGKIVGEVHPSEFRSLVTAKNATNTISAYTNEDGDFTLYGVPEGTYQITVIAEEASGLEAITKDNVVVENGEITDVETLFLE